MTATVQIHAGISPETASCFLKDGLGFVVASYTGQITLNNFAAGEITLTGFNSNGGTTTLSCNDSIGAFSVEVAESVITAIPVTSVHTG